VLENIDIGNDIMGNLLLFIIMVLSKKKKKSLRKQNIM